MTDPWLDIVGVSESGLKNLPPDTQALLERAEVVIGVRRRLDGLDAAGKELVEWEGNLKQMVAKIMKFRHRKTVLLATGDPNWFGIAATLSRQLPAEQFATHPVPSSFQLAAARLKWPLQNVETLSAHARPVEILHPHILPQNRILALTSDASTLEQIADLMVARGYGRSRLTVLEDLGSTKEKIRTFRASEAGKMDTGDFYVLGIECVADDRAPLLPPIPGLPDDAFAHDGQLTKREVRAATLSALLPYPDALLWDVGAGAGSVAIEWMRAAPRARAICFEQEGGRCDLIAHNAKILGVPGLEIVAGSVPQALDGQKSPDAIFWGGDLDHPALFDALWGALRSGGMLVANAVTVSGRQMLFSLQERLGGTLTEIAISRLDKVGAQKVMRPKMPVLQWAVRKPEGDR